MGLRIKKARYFLLQFAMDWPTGSKSGAKPEWRSELYRGVYEMQYPQYSATWIRSRLSYGQQYVPFLVDLAQFVGQWGEIQSRGYDILPSMKCHWPAKRSL